MFTRALMTVTAVTFALAGGVALFLPGEASRALGLEVATEAVVQVAAAGFLALAALNWLGRTAIYGGIFGRPIVVANLTFGTVAALSLIPPVVRGESAAALWLLAAPLALHTLAFAYLMKAPPASGRVVPGRDGAPPRTAQTSQDHT